MLFLFRNLFGGVSSITVSNDHPLTITMVESVEGEELQIAQPVSHVTIVTRVSFRGGIPLNAYIYIIRVFFL